MAYWPNQDRSVRLGRPTKYNWEDWTDGREHLLKEGRDFDCMAESFVLLAKRTGRVRGMDVIATTISTGGGEPTPFRLNGDSVKMDPGSVYILLKFTPKA